MLYSLAPDFSLPGYGFYSLLQFLSPAPIYIIITINEVIAVHGYNNENKDNLVSSPGFLACNIDKLGMGLWMRLKRSEIFLHSIINSCSLDSQVFNVAVYNIETLGVVQLYNHTKLLEIKIVPSIAINEKRLVQTK